MVTVERLVVTVERLVVTVERLVVTYGVRQPSGTGDPLTYQVGPGVDLRNIPLKALERPVKALDTWLGTHKYMLGDDRWSIADLNVASVVSWGFQTLFMEGEWLRQYPNVVRWWNETTNRPAFAQKTKTTNLDTSKL